MEVINRLIEEGVYHSPLTLLSINDNKVIEKINNYLPYSVGIEIECNIKNYENFKSKVDFEEKFCSIPNIIHVDCDSGEQRFRIPNGFQGLICLYNISQQLKIYSELNLGSGIHYHIDMTDCYDLLNNQIINENSKYILDELSTWDYKGTYNSKICNFSTSHHWIRFQNNFKTAEIRIGEMTFDYEVLVKRIIHSNQIIKKLKNEIPNYISNIKYETCNAELLLNYHKNTNYNVDNSQIRLNELNKQLSSLEELKTEEITEEKMKQSINKRIFKVKNNGK